MYICIYIYIIYVKLQSLKNAILFLTLCGFLGSTASSASAIWSLTAPNIWIATHTYKYCLLPPSIWIEQCNSQKTNIDLKSCQASLRPTAWRFTLPWPGPRWCCRGHLLFQVCIRICLLLFFGLCIRHLIGHLLGLSPPFASSWYSPVQVRPCKGPSLLLEGVYKYIYLCIYT